MFYDVICGEKGVVINKVDRGMVVEMGDSPTVSTMGYIIEVNDREESI